MNQICFVILAKLGRQINNKLLLLLFIIIQSTMIIFDFYSVSGEKRIIDYSLFMWISFPNKNGYYKLILVIIILIYYSIWYAHALTEK